MRQLSRLFMILSALCFAMPAFAQGGGTSEASWIAITAGFSMAIASAVCGLAQGKAVAAATESLARNPAARPGIQFALILGLVLQIDGLTGRRAAENRPPIRRRATRTMALPASERHLP